MVFVTQKKKISYQKFNKKKLGSSHKVTLFISKKSGMINKFIHKIKTVFFLKFHTQFTFYGYIFNNQIQIFKYVYIFG